MESYIRNIHTMEQLTRLQANLNLLKMHKKQNDAAGKPTIDVEVVGLRVGDFVLVQIDEHADAKGAATTNLSQKNDGQAGASALLGIMPALKRAYPNMDPEKLVAYASQSAFAGAGDTARNGELRGSIAVRIVKEMPNGDLFLEGTKVVLINNEEYHLYVSGLARRADIAQDNTLSSSRLADAQIEFTGRGDMADQQRKGWATRLFDTLNPF